MPASLDWLIGNVTYKKSFRFGFDTRNRINLPNRPEIIAALLSREEQTRERGVRERGMDPWEAIFEALIKKGWSFRDPEDIKSLIRRKNSLESTESELLNMDLRSIGAKSLPDASSLNKPSSHLNGPKVLQVKVTIFFLIFSYNFSG